MTITVLQRWRKIVQRVEIGNETISIYLNPANAAPEVTFSGAEGSIRREIGLELRRHGVEARLVIGGIEHRPVGANPALIRLLASSRLVGEHRKRPGLNRTDREAREAFRAICGISCIWLF